MVDSINNSTGVLGALRYLQSSTIDLSKAESRLSSGLKVNSARDNVTAYHSAQVMKGQGSSLNAVTLSLSRAESISDTAIGAAERISDLLIEMKQTVGAMMQNDLTPDQRQAYASRFTEQKRQIETFVQNASFDDSNLLNGSKPNGVSFIADSEATVTVTLAGRNFLNGGGVITLDRFDDLHDPDSAAETMRTLDESIKNVGEQLNDMVSERKRIEAQKGFVSKLADALAAGVGRMVDADLGLESALIQALQIKQELSARSVGIVNNAPNTLLSLFRS